MGEMGVSETGRRDRRLRNERGQFVGYQRRPLCHPDRKYCAKDLCKSCYSYKQSLKRGRKAQKEWNKRNPVRMRKKRIEEKLKKFTSLTIIPARNVREQEYVNHLYLKKNALSAAVLAGYEIEDPTKKEGK